MKIGFVTDTNADIPDHILKQHPIKVVPEIIIIGEKEYLDGIDITRDEFYEQLPGLDPPPTTAAPAPRAFEAAYKEMFDKGYDHIISIHTAAKLSAIHNAAMIAANNFEGQVDVIDSNQLTLGIGYQVLAASEAVKAGKSLDEIRQVIEDTRKRTKVFALLDTLENLKRSGRVSWVQAGLGDLMQVKLIIEVKDGEIRRTTAARTRQKAVARLQELFETCGRLDWLAILHAGAEEEARAFYNRLIAKGTAKEPMYVNITSTIGTHTGVNALGFAVVTKK